MDTAGNGPLAPPPPVLDELVAAALRLPEGRRRGPFGGAGDDQGLTVAIGDHGVFLPDGDIADLIAGDYVDVRAGPAGATVVLLPRAFAWVRDQAD